VPLKFTLPPPICHAGEALGYGVSRSNDVSVNSSTGKMTFEAQLQAVGRLLDQRMIGAKEICVLQAGDGFVVHLLKATSALSGPAFAPATLVLEAADIKAAMDLTDPPKKASGWWGR
jgi:hypothetical protein